MSTIPQQKHTLSNGKHIILRSANPSDSAPLIELTASILIESKFLVTQSEEFSVTVDEERNWIVSYIDSPDKILILAENSDGIIGMANVQASRRLRVKHRADLGIIILQSWRGQGVGKLLMQTIIDWARVHPAIEKLSLSVFAENTTAINLYSSLGFIEEGRRPNEYKISENAYMDDIMMYLWVK